MKEKRNLSGIYFRHQEEDGAWGNRVFEDLSFEEQTKLLNDKSKEQVKSLAIQLANTINRLGNEFDIVMEPSPITKKAVSKICIEKPINLISIELNNLSNPKNPE